MNCGFIAECLEPPARITLCISDFNLFVTSNDANTVRERSKLTQVEIRVECTQFMILLD